MEKQPSFPALVTGAAIPKASPSPKQKEILVPIDFSEPSLNALRHARKLAAGEKAHLTLVNVVEEPGSFRTLDVVGQRRARYEQRLNRLQELAGRELGSQVASRIEVREGNASVEIARLATQRQVDLIVVGRHHHHGLWQWLQGRTASTLSKKAGCPVLLIEPDHRN